VLGAELEGSAKRILRLSKEEEFQE